MQLACVVVDEPIVHDHRVLSALAASDRVYVVNLASVRRDRDLWDSLAALTLMLRGLCAGLVVFRKLRTVLKGTRRYPLFAGLVATFKWCQAVQAVGIEKASCLHAHDLYPATAAVRAALPHERVIYDSHEIQFHRNRKTGWLRILIEAGLERMVLKRADELRVVSHAIARLMGELYGMLPPTCVVYNDFYAHHDLPAPLPHAPLALVYVGKGLSGRMLEALDLPPQDLGAELFIYPLGAALPPHISGEHWHFGPEEYEPHLLELVRSRRCLMWCCHENHCLSYSYALPNKFFQALAVGMPVVALRGTYLAKIVEEHGLGPVYEDGETPKALLEIARGPLFEKWRSNILCFREHVRNGSVVI